MDQDKQQQDLWQSLRNNLIYSALSNALYERELYRLARDESFSDKRLRLRLMSLPFHVGGASQRILDAEIPLELDSQNGSWLGAQASQVPGVKQKEEDVYTFFKRNHRLALVVPVYAFENGYEILYLDNIDQVNETSEKIHLNKFGWFNFSGLPLEQQVHTVRALKPLKSVMTAACCGHQWLNRKRKNPRLLSLREMLLATQINWQKLSQPVELKLVK